MNDLQKIIQLLEADFEMAAAKPANKFFAHIDIKNQKIVGVSGSSGDENGIYFLELEESIAIPFLSGEENPNNWRVNLDNEVYSIAKIQKHEEFNYDRIKLNPIVKIEEYTAQQLQDKPHASDLVIYFNKYENLMYISYNGDLINNAAPIKFYVTRANDLSELKCTISLSADILDDIIKTKGLETWPNPVSFSLPCDLDDISFYAKKSHINAIVVKS